MNVLLKETPSEEGRVVLDTLKLAVSHALEKKRRLELSNMSRMAPAAPAPPSGAAPATPAAKAYST